MKRKILKIVTVILLLAILTVPNFIYVGTGLVSYAVDSIATNHQNVEFDAKLKEGNVLELLVNVKKEGYFNGEISLENSNFTFELEQTNPNINKIENNKVTLNQINAGSNVQIDLQIQPVTDEIFDAGLLNVSSKINLTGVYRDSTQKDINIKGTREVKLEYTEDNTSENIESTTKVITNKVIKISGEDKRVVQLEMNFGLKENNYPIKEINSIIRLPIIIESNSPEVVKKVNLNTMRDFTYNYDGESKIELNFKNEANQENDNKVLWKKQGNEKVILTLIYDKEVSLENFKIPYEETVTLFNGKELKVTNELELNNEEKEKLVNITETNIENIIYKGKLNAGIDRQYETKTNIAVNLANAEKYIKINEGETKYLLQDEQEVSANAIFNKTVINKNSFDKILGENGQITISNEEGEIIAIVNNKTIADENNNIVINYEGKELKTLNIKTTVPVLEGDLELVHTKTIKQQDREIVKSATEIITKSTYEYNENEEKEKNVAIKLEDTKIEAGLVIDKDTLSTVVENNVEIKAILKGNNEQYELYKNPNITFELPEDVENIEISDIKLIYENELKIKNYEVNGRNLTVYLEGEQTEYKNTSIEGTVIVINIKATVDKKASTKDSKIIMTVNNEENTVVEEKNVKVISPKDVTAINSIKELNIETIGQEEIVKASIERGKEAKQLETNFEIINNNENSIEDVKILGTFPTKNQQNNIDIKIVEGIKLKGIEEAKIYYTEKEDATEDIKNTANAWKQEIENPSKVKKYLIEIPSMDKQSSIEGNYKLEIPELLEYNQSALAGYTVKYTNTLTKISSEIKATNIVLETGVGPILEAKLIQTVGGKEINNNETIKNGEVIKYKIEVSNTGSEELSNVLITGKVPEGTTLVKPQDNYEYTGASYYKELDNKTFEAKIEKVGVGQVITGGYEVRVNKNTQAGTKLENNLEIKYGDVIKQSNSTEAISENGDIRVSVKRVTDRNVDLYESGTVQYFAIVENISNNRQDNIQVNTNLPNGLEVERLNLITGMEATEVSDDDLRLSSGEEKIETREITENELTIQNSDESVKTENLNYEKTINIGSLDKGEAKVLSYDMLINKIDNSNKREFSVVATAANKEYKSNVLTDSVKKVDVSLNMTTNVQGQYVKSGDTIEYIITVKNNGSERIEGLKIKDTIPESLTVTKLNIENEDIDQNYNEVEVSCNIAAKSEMIIKIETVVNYSASRTTAEAISNVAYAEMLGEKVATTSEMNHIIQADSEEPSTPTNDDPSGDIANGKGTIMGLAWFDQNANGKKDDDEKTLNNVRVYLLNTNTNNLVKDTNGKTLEATTNDNGVYILDHIGNGKYIVVFDYDKTLYTLTKYKAENVEESKNSNVMTNELLIENEKQQVASTDIVEINDNNISNINIGLIELKDFAFRLDKYVSRILIQNSAGTVVKEYTNASVAKAELDSKTVNGTTVIIEYELKVTNIGEIDGYVRKIVDYVPSDLKFSSELNKDWYQVGSDLYNASLANEKIAAGESKSVRLTLTKAMTENNTGLINNTAEIAESYNELGIADSKSTGGNKAQGENDYSSADTILSIKTGEEVYATFIAIGIILLGITTIIIVRKKQNMGDIK